MQQILIAQAGEGMILAKDVETAEGRVLCGKGTELTGCLVERLKKMEVTHVTVEGHPVEDANEKTLEQELLDIERRFSRVKHIPPLRHLKKRLMERAVEARKEV
ncbi:MAG: hypothetical protein OEV73_08270 [Desulfobulbaceae bacterium]|nr:hypothetical protein [Desulfobulbaceae bacterium]